MASTAHAIYGPDAWIGSVVLEDATIRVQGSGGSPTYNVDLTDGRYWLAGGVAGFSWSESADYPLFYDHALGQMDAAWSGTAIEASAQDPVSPEDHSAARLQMRAYDSGGAVEWQIDFDNSPNVDPTWFGFAASAGVIASDAAGIIRSPYTVPGRWVSNSEIGGRARRKSPGREILRRYSSDLLVEAARETWGRYDLLRVEYDLIPAALVYARKSADPARASYAQVVPDDPHCDLQPIWEQLGDGQQIILIHDEGQSSGLTIPDDRWEIVEAWSRDGWERLHDLATPLDEDARDFYTVRWPWLHVTRRSSYGG